MDILGGQQQKPYLKFLTLVARKTKTLLPYYFRESIDFKYGS